MRYGNSLSLAALVLLPVWQLTAVLFSSAADAAPPSWNGSPVIGQIRLAPIDHLQRDFAFLAEGVEQGSTTRVREFFNELSEGIDARHPAGAALLFDETLVPIIFMPVKDEDRLLAVLGTRLGWNFRPEADGFYRATDAAAKTDLVARRVGSWIFVTGASHRDKLRNVPADPTAIFAGIDPTLTAHAALHVDQLPPEMHQQLIRTLHETFAGAAGEQLASGSSRLIEPWAQRLLAETKSLQFELQCFRPLEQFHVTSRLTAVEGSLLAAWIDNASWRSAAFSQLPSRDAIFSMIASLKLDPATLRPLLDAWEPVAATARASAPSPASRNHVEGLLGRVVAQAVDAVTTTLQEGELDGGLVVEQQGGDQIVLLAGATLRGARAVEDSATELATLLQQSAEFRALGWSVGANGDVSLHQFTIPMDDESTRPLFGDNLHMAVGVGTDKVYAALGGEEALGRMSIAIDRAREDAPPRGELLRITARMAPFLATLNAVPGNNAESDQSVREYAAQIAPYKKNDTLELSLKAEDRALEGRLRIDMGIVRMLASKIPGEDSPVRVPVAGAATGTLRLQAGQQFQLEFHTKSEITTTIDGQDRLDRGVHSLTYDFHTINVDPDGTMHLETSLHRATIDKTSPEGRELFDSQNPPEQDNMTAEMMLHLAVIGEPFLLTVRPDGTITEIGGIQEAIENVVDTKFKPSADERERARAFVAQIFNEAGLRDSLTRGFEFYPGRHVTVGDRWTRTSENRSLMNFLLDNRYQVRTDNGNEVAISVRSQVREPAAAVARQPVEWDIVGSQVGSFTLDPRDGLLRLAEYTLRLNAEATFEMDGQMVSRPLVSVFEMTIGRPRQVGEPTAGDAPPAATRPTGWIDLTGETARPKWRPSQREGWHIEGNQIVSWGGDFPKWSYCEYTDQTFADFELTAKVLYSAGCNGGICFRASHGGLDGANPSGYEVQLLGMDTQRNPTGSIYKMPAKGKVSGVYSARPGLVRPNQWFSVRVLAQGTRLTVYIDNAMVATYDDVSTPMRSGHIILQGSPEGVIRYKDVRIRPL